MAAKRTGRTPRKAARPVDENWWYSWQPPTQAEWADYEQAYLTRKEQQKSRVGLDANQTPHGKIQGHMDDSKSADQDGPHRRIRGT